LLYIANILHNTKIPIYNEFWLMVLTLFRRHACFYTFSRACWQAIGWTACYS